MSKCVAIEIKNEETADIVRALFPELWDISLKVLFGQFLIFTRPGVERKFELASPGAVREHYDHIENGPEIALKFIVEK